MQNNPGNHTDISSLLINIQQRLTSLENKVDILVSRVLPARAVESKPLSAPVQKPAQVNSGNAGSQDNSNHNKNRIMHKTICADCKKECEVPFRPSGDRPVYCRECFARRKAGNSLRAGIDVKPKETPLAHINLLDEKAVGEKEKLVAKRDPVKKKRVIAKKKSATEKKTSHKIKVIKVSKKKKAR
jgi:CxxC-x17-CxxC domain-containing protein